LIIYSVLQPSFSLDASYYGGYSTPALCSCDERLNLAGARDAKPRPFYHTGLVFMIKFNLDFSFGMLSDHRQKCLALWLGDGSSLKHG
jgi:hypothetical protein